MKGMVGKRRYERLLVIRAPVQFAEDCEVLLACLYTTAMLLWSAFDRDATATRVLEMSQAGSRMSCNATQSPWVHPPVTIMWMRARIDSH